MLYFYKDDSDIKLFGNHSRGWPESSLFAIPFPELLHFTFDP